MSLELLPFSSTVLLILTRSRTPLFLAAWTVTTATAVASISLLAIKSRTNTNIARQSESFHLAHYPMLINAFFIVVPILLVALQAATAFISR